MEETPLRSRSAALGIDPAAFTFSSSFWPRDWEGRKEGEECSVSKGGVAEMDLSSEDCGDSVILVSGARMVTYGLKDEDFNADDIVALVNAGGGAVDVNGSCAKFLADSSVLGGEVVETKDLIADSGDYPFLYQSARKGDCQYKFEGLKQGDYFIDLHFAEIIFIYGPKGMRAFNVFLQDEKILSELDIYAAVGGNKPLQLVDIRTTVVDSGNIVIKFEGVRGCPIICGISIRRAAAAPAEQYVRIREHICKKCSSGVEASPSQNGARGQIIAKFEKKILELTSQYNSKCEECFTAWSAVTAANEELESLKMKYHHQTYNKETLEMEVEKHKESIEDVSARYQHEKKLWTASICDLGRKIMALKKEHDQLSVEAHQCVSSIPDLSKMTAGVQALVVQCEDLKRKYADEIAKRKKLFNELQEMKGNIRVFCRCRPLSKNEVSSGCATAVDLDGAKDGEIGISGNGASRKTFKFDRVYAPKDDQADVYSDASPLVTSVLDGYNVCIFAYGQTGTGKTYTMEGTERNRGVNYRTLEELFRIAEERRDTILYSMSISVLEVYNEQIRDLLAPSPSSKKLEVRQAVEGSHHVPGIVEANVESIDVAWDVLQAGKNARAVGSNNVNEHSSRSHCMICIAVRAENLMNGECTRSKLWLVDLAGSERLDKTNAQGDRLKEAQFINKSLSALGDVISALSAKNNHIPYRNSKLTHLLQDSLGGDSKALMFVQISPSDGDLGESLSSLNFASRVRGVELGPARRQADTGELQKVKQLLERARQDAKSKDDFVRKVEENCQILESKMKGKDQLHKTLQEKIKELEYQVHLKMDTQQLTERQHVQQSEKLKEKEELCSTLQLKLKDVECKSVTEIAALQNKVKELECKLRMQENDCTAAELKIKELEFQLSNRAKSEMLLRTKVRELESHAQQVSTQLGLPDGVTTETLQSSDTFSTDVPMTENDDPNVWYSRSSSSLAFAKEIAGSHDHEIRRKRSLRNASLGDPEKTAASAFENVVAPKRSIASESNNKVRRVDPPKIGARPTRASKALAMAIQKNHLPNDKAAGKEHASGVKSRGWVR